MFKEAMPLEELVDMHTRKRKKATYYSRQCTLFLCIVCLVFFGSIVMYQTSVTTMNQITGLAIYIDESPPIESIGNSISNVAAVVTAVKTSPDVTMYKLFFYTLWILVVLVGSALYSEFER